jgi:hypothetical protein
MLKYKFEIDAHPVSSKEGSPVFKFTARFRKETRKDMIKLLLPDYWRWVAEGKRPYGTAGGFYIGNGGQKYTSAAQCLYDPYHTFIEYQSDTDSYTYDIQTDDSPDGDTWVKGRFRIDCGEIKFIGKEKTHG